MTSLVVLSVGIALSPVAGLVPLILWARWLGRRPAAPRWVGRISYALLAFGALVTVFGAVLVLRAASNASAGEPVENARLLAEGISEAMNGGAFAMLVAVVAALWLLFATWRWHWTLKRRV